jgi:PAS domain S-box-containing protein
MRIAKFAAVPHRKQLVHGWRTVGYRRVPIDARVDVEVLTSEFLRSALESSPDAMIIVDPAGSIVFGNAQLSALFGYSRGEIIGTSVERLMPERLRAQHVGQRERFSAERRMRPMGLGLELLARRKDGSEFPVEISLSSIKDGEGTLVVAAIRDMTERKRVQRALIDAREAADRARQIAEEAHEAADQASRGKSRFLATASHDLRQPLQTLAVLNGTLRGLVHRPNALEALAHQDQAIGAMARLLDALLDISKLESGAIKSEPMDFSVGALFDALRGEFASLAANKGLQLQSESSSDYAYSDPSLVGQILRHLVSNAIKYTRAGSVRLRSLRVPQGVRIEVIDTGIGIGAEQLPLLMPDRGRPSAPSVRPVSTRGSPGSPIGANLVRAPRIVGNPS